MKKDTKIKEGIEQHRTKCTCSDPYCYKCIGINCQDDNCSTHPLLAKMLARDKTRK